MVRLSDGCLCSISHLSDTQTSKICVKFCRCFLAEVNSEGDDEEEAGQSEGEDEKSAEEEEEARDEEDSVEERGSASEPEIPVVAKKVMGKPTATFDDLSSSEVRRLKVDYIVWWLLHIPHGNVAVEFMALSAGRGKGGGRGNDDKLEFPAVQSKKSIFRTASNSDIDFCGLRVY